MIAAFLIEDSLTKTDFPDPVENKGKPLFVVAAFDRVSLPKKTIMY